MLKKDGIVLSTLEEMVMKREEAEEKEFEKKLEKDKINFQDQIEKRIKTSFVGAIASFEGHFGRLWGHNEIALTENQQKARDIWAKVRKEIFDKGNDQIKNFKKDLDCYEVEKVGYSYELSLNLSEERA